jgi:hypothetical protein
MDYYKNVVKLYGNYNETKQFIESFIISDQWKIEYTNNIDTLIILSEQCSCKYWFIEMSILYPKITFILTYSNRHTHLYGYLVIMKGELVSEDDYKLMVV